MPIIGGGSGSPYCTEQQARDAGASGTQAEVLATIASAEERVNRFTSQLWSPRVTTVAADLTGKGVALLPRQLDPDEDVLVRVQGATTDLPVTSYQWTSGRVPGQVDAVYLGAGGSDILIAGAEPYNGGWSNLLPRTGQVLVTATFGTATTPYEVTRATALLAASISQGGPTTEPAQPSVNTEGETLAITTDQQATVENTLPIRTTGLAAADALLAPLRKRPVRLTGV
jgi:hypothetical protein